MAYTNNVAWEIRPTNGSDNNGGAYNASATASGGVDYSQQNSAQVVFDGSTIRATTAGASSTITVVGYTVATGDLGNFLKITGGTNFTTGRYQITAISTGSNTWTLDRTATSGAGSAMTGNMGGAAQTLSGVLADANSANGARSNKYFVKAESTITTTAGFALAAPASSLGPTQPPNYITAYTTTRGDGGKATITLSTNVGLNGFDIQTGGWVVENFIINCNSLATSTGIFAESTNAMIRNCKISNFKTAGINASNTLWTIVNCEITGGLSGATAGIVTSSSGVIANCYVHDNVCTGMNLGQQTAVVNCVVTNSTGTNNDGILVGNSSAVVNNVSHGHNRYGLNMNAGNSVFYLKNNILSSNGSYGLRLATSAGYPADFQWDGNAYYNNTTGTRLNADDTGTTNAINGVSPYTNSLDVILTANPFTNSASGDFTLNNTAGGGAACRGHGIPGAMPGLSQVGYMDMGAFQAQATSTSSGGGFF